MAPSKSDIMDSGSKWSFLLKKIRKLFHLLLLFGGIFLAGWIYWKYFFTYSDGSRVGLLQKFSRKGVLFKTYEGELILSSVTGTNNVVLASEKFYFSVVDKNLAVKLDSLQGQRIVVYYKQKNAPLFWKGETPYYVTKAGSK
jgi:hypothetical protein